MTAATCRQREVRSARPRCTSDERTALRWLWDRMNSQVLGHTFNCSVFLLLGEKKKLGGRGVFYRLLGTGDSLYDSLLRCCGGGNGFDAELVLERRINSELFSMRRDACFLFLLQLTIFPQKGEVFM